jgi:hypothetical protein
VLLAESGAAVFARTAPLVEVEAEVVLAEAERVEVELAGVLVLAERELIVAGVAVAARGAGTDWLTD